MKTIEITIRPYCYRREEIAVGTIDADGNFVQDRKLWNVTKDARLSVKRSYEGRGAQQDVTFVIQVPDEYPLAIAKGETGDVDKTRASRTYTILYNPAEIAEVQANITNFFAVLAQIVEQEQAKASEKSAKRSRKPRVQVAKMWRVTERMACGHIRTIWIEAVSRTAAKALYALENIVAGNSRLTASVLR